MKGVGSYDRFGAGIYTADEKHDRDEHQPCWCKRPVCGLPGVNLVEELVILCLQGDMEAPVRKRYDNPIREERRAGN